MQNIINVFKQVGGLSPENEQILICSIHKITLGGRQLDNHRRDALKRGFIEKVCQGV